MKRIMVSEELFEKLNERARLNGVSVTDYVSRLVQSFGLDGESHKH